MPATRTAFWLDKIAGNVARDARDRQKLAEQGWRVLIVWECALRGRLKLNDEALTERLEEWICGAGHDAQIDTQGSANWRYFDALQGVASLRTGKRYFPSVTSTTAKIITASASHSIRDRLSPPNPVPSRTATTGLT